MFEIITSIQIYPNPSEGAPGIEPGPSDPSHLSIYPNYILFPFSEQIECLKNDYLLLQTTSDGDAGSQNIHNTSIINNTSNINNPITSNINKPIPFNDT